MAKKNKSTEYTPITPKNFREKLKGLASLFRDILWLATTAFAFILFASNSWFAFKSAHIIAIIEDLTSAIEVNAANISYCRQNYEHIQEVVEIYIKEDRKNTEIVKENISEINGYLRGIENR